MRIGAFAAVQYVRVADMICEGCVFRGVIAERRQDACAYCDGEVEAVKVLQGGE